MYQGKKNYMAGCSRRWHVSDQFWKNCARFWGFCSGVAEDSSTFGCDVMSHGNQTPTFWKNTLSSRCNAVLYCSRRVPQEETTHNIKTYYLQDPQLLHFCDSLWTHQSFQTTGITIIHRWTLHEDQIQCQLQQNWSPHTVIIRQAELSVERLWGQQCWPLRCCSPSHTTALASTTFTRPTSGKPLK
jgi:hypothetical protein